MPTELRTAYRRATATGLADLAGRADCTVQVCLDERGTVHHRYGCVDARGRLTTTTVPVTELLTGRPLHGPCTADLGADLDDMPDIDAFWQALKQLAGVRTDLARLTARTARAPRLEPGGTVSIRRSLTEHQRTLAQLAGAEPCRTHPSLHLAVEESSRAVAAQLKRLTQWAASAGHRDRVVAFVAEAMVPARWRDRVVLDRQPTLVAVCGQRPQLPPKVAEVLEAFDARHSPTRLLVACPRFVADYLNRHLLTATGPWGVLVQVVDVTGLGGLVDDVWAVWDPNGAGADLGTVVAALRGVHTAAAGP